MPNQITIEPKIILHLSNRLMERDPSISSESAHLYVEVLVPETLIWLKKMSLDEIGCRPVYSDGMVVGATLCDHTVNGCDCGVHGSTFAH